MICKSCGEWKKAIERNGNCADCNLMDRKVSKAKAAEPKKPIKKVSDVRRKELQVYARIREQILMNNWCAYHGRPCIPTQLHHVKGRTGVNEKGEPMLTDPRYLLPVCDEAHRWIEEHPREAKEQGYSESRLT